MRRTAVLAGYYGFGNTGDEAILSSILAGLRRRVPEARFVVVSGDPESTARRHGVEAIDWRDVAALSRKIAESDAVVIGGGGLFQDYWGLDTSTLLTPRHGEIAFYTAPAVLAALAKKPALLYGLGFGPLASPEARRYVRAAADTAVHLSVRDEASRDLLVDIGIPAQTVRVSADPAFALVSRAGVSPRDLCREHGVEPRGPVVAVALRPWSIGVEPAAWEAQTAQALDTFLERTDATLLFVPFEKSPWTGKDDFEQSARLAAGLSHRDRAAVLQAPLSPEETAGLLGACDLVVGMRLHALVFAAAGSVPCVGLAYDPKVSALLERLGVADMGIALPGLTADALVAVLERARDEAPALSQRLRQAAGKLRALALDDLDRVGRLIDAPAPAPPLTERVVALLDDALQANFEEARGIRSRLSESEVRLGELERAHAREKELLEARLGETRQELAKLQTSNLWRAANLYWRTRRAVASAARRLVGRSPSDWAGADHGTRAARRAAPMPEDNRYDVVWLSREGFESLPERTRAILERYAAQGHRVFCVPPGAAARVTHAERLFELSLPGDGFAALDALARQESFGATAVFVEDAAVLPLGRRMRAARAWLLVDATGERDHSPDPADLVLDPAASPEDVLHAVPRFFPKASIVVVTHENRDVNRLCLESLRARTEWPNFEIIAVDNGSTDGTRALLEEIARGWPALRVLANAENRGFAAAVNQGFAAASGSVLVMLNNDTVVTRGWLTSLVKHLRADPHLGLVGPATNAISNEAQVPVGYRGLADLPAWAASYVRERDGESFAIPMLAFFCTALRRETWEAVGPLDERFGAGMFEDDDYCRRARAQGYEIRCARDGFVHHWQKASFRRLGEKAYFALYEENRRKYEEKWGGGQAPAAPPRADVGRYAGQLQELLARFPERRGTVVFLPSVGWGIHLFQRPHHLARAFARAGWLAIFDCSNAQDQVDGFKEIEPGLVLYRGPAGVLERISEPLLWSFPYNYGQAAAFGGGARVVYDWIDDLSVFPYDRTLLETNHARALAEATVVAAVARRLHEEALLARPDAVYLPNGVEYERFASAAAPVADDRDLEPLLSAGRPIAGYYGALAEWFDYELLDAAARARPDWSFLLIGPMYDQSLQGKPMLKRDNVRWIGPRDYHRLPGYLALFDVATIPFQINPITTATSPLKLFEYFAGGKPVVTTPMPECAAFPEVSIAADARAFAAALDPARERGRDPKFRERLRTLGRENSWDARVRSALAALEAVVATARVR